MKPDPTRFDSELSLVSCEFSFTLSRPPASLVESLEQACLVVARQGAPVLGEEDVQDARFTRSER